MNRQGPIKDGFMEIQGNRILLNPSPRHSGECRKPVEKRFVIMKKAACPLDSGLRRNDGPRVTAGFLPAVAESESMRLPCMEIILCNATFDLI